MFDEAAPRAAPGFDLDRLLAFELHADPDALLRLALDPRLNGAAAMRVIEDPAFLHAGLTFRTGALRHPFLPVGAHNATPRDAQPALIQHYVPPVTLHA